MSHRDARDFRAVSDPIYEQLKRDKDASLARQRANLTLVRPRREEIIRSDERLTRWKNASGALCGLGFCSVIPGTYAVLMGFSWLAVPTVVVIGLAAWACSRIETRELERVLKAAAPELEELSRLESEARHSIDVITKGFDERIQRHLDQVTYRPPDWRERCKQVLARDGHRCQNPKCNYPVGFQRRSRQLHVHHMKALSEGGNNELANLLTLCHICHRKVDAKHRGVKKMPVTTWRRGYRRRFWR